MFDASYVVVVNTFALKGKLADLVVINQDYLTCPEDDIKNIEPVMTILDGKIVYRRQSFPSSSRRMRLATIVRLAKNRQALMFISIL